MKEFLRQAGIVIAGLLFVAWAFAMILAGLHADMDLMTLMVLTQ